MLYCILIYIYIYILYCSYLNFWILCGRIPTATTRNCRICVYAWITTGSIVGGLTTKRVGVPATICRPCRLSLVDKCVACVIVCVMCDQFLTLNLNYKKNFNLFLLYFY